MNPQFECQIQHQEKLPPSEGMKNMVTIRFETITEKIHEDPVTGIQSLVESGQEYMVIDFSIESTCHSHIRDLLLDRLMNHRWISAFLAPHIASAANDIGFGVNGFVIRLCVTLTKRVSALSSESMLQFQRLVCKGTVDGEELKRETEPCSICLENLSGSKTRGVPTRMPCSHVFHDRCLLEWFGRKNTCPMCRRVVSE